MAGLLTAEELRKWLSYDPDTGHFTSIAPRPRIRVGSIAGTKMKHGYIAICLHRRYYLAHRLAWLYVYGEWPAQEVDHINHDRSDNRIQNLRQASRKQNSENHTLRRNNTSGIKGVGWDTNRKKWKAQIRHNGKTLMLGRFDEIDAAVRARQAAVQKYFTHAWA